MHHSWGLDQLMGVAGNRAHDLALAVAAGRKKESCYPETGTNSNLFYLKYISKVPQDLLKCKESSNQNNNYNSLLCFKLDKVSRNY